MELIIHNWRLLTFCFITFVILNAFIAAIIYYILISSLGSYFFEKGKENKGEEIDANVDFNYENHHLTKQDNVKLNAYFVKNQETNVLIVVLHGYGANAKQLLSYVKHFHSKGYNVLIPDLKGHGDSGGICGLGCGDVKDIVLWIKYIEVQTSTQYHKVLFGTSMGAATAINIALYSCDLRYAAVIADSVPPDILVIIQKVFNWTTNYPWKLVKPFLIVYLKLFSKLTVEDLSLYGKIHSLNTPILFIHGKKDGLIDLGSVEDLYKIVKCKKDFLIIEEANHVGPMDTAPEIYWNKVDGFIMDELQSERMR